MSADILKQILTIIAGILVSGAVPLAIYLGNRRESLRKMRAETGVNQSQVYDQLIDRLQGDNVTHREQVKELRGEVRALEEKADRAQQEFAEQLEVANQERRRLLLRIAQLETDLDIAQRQLESMRRTNPPGVS